MASPQSSRLTRRCMPRRLSGRGALILCVYAAATGSIPCWPQEARVRCDLFRWCGGLGTGGAQFNGPWGIALDRAGNLYVSDWYNHRIQKLDAQGTCLGVLGTQGSGPSQFSYPRGVAVFDPGTEDTQGVFYVADLGNDRIQKFTLNGDFLLAWGTSGQGDGQFHQPSGVAVDASGTVYVADTANHRIQVFTPDGQFIRAWGHKGSGQGEIDCPGAPAIDREGNLYVPDVMNHRVHRFTADGELLCTWGEKGTGEGQFDLPHGVAVDHAGRVYVADTCNARVQVFTAEGKHLFTWGTPGTTPDTFCQPHTIAVMPTAPPPTDRGAPEADRVGLYVTDFANHGVLQFVLTWPKGPGS